MGIKQVSISKVVSVVSDLEMVTANASRSVITNHNVASASAEINRINKKSAPLDISNGLFKIANFHWNTGGSNGQCN